MQLEIEHGPVFSILRVRLAQGEQWRAEAGAMVAMSPTIDLEAKTSGKGLLGSLKAVAGGESFFASLFTATRGEGELVLAPAMPGDIMRIDLNGTIFAEGGAYLAGHPGLEISTQGSAKGLLSGEGLFLQVIRGQGPVFLSCYGAIVMKALAPGESFIVDTGHLVAFEEGVRYAVRKAAKGLLSSIATGEGLVCEYTGPGRILYQTRNLGAFAHSLAKFLPARG